MKNKKSVFLEVKKAKRLLEAAMEILEKNIGQDYRIDEDILEVVDRDAFDFVYEKMEKAIFLRVGKLVTEEEMEEIDDLIFDLVSCGVDDEEVIYNFVEKNIINKK